MLLNLHFNIEHAILFTPWIFATWITLFSEIYLLILLTSSLNHSIMAFLSSQSLTWTFPGLMSAFSPLSSTSSRFLSNSILFSLNLFSESFFFCKKSMMLDVMLPEDPLRLITGPLNVLYVRLTGELRWVAIPLIP